MPAKANLVMVSAGFLHIGTAAEKKYERRPESCSISSGGGGRRGERGMSVAVAYLPEQSSDKCMSLSFGKEKRRKS